MTINKTIAFVSDFLDLHIEIPVPIGTTVLTTEHVQYFFKKTRTRHMFGFQKV